MIDTRSQRERKSDERAQELCREIRFQISQFGCINPQAVFPLLMKWMNVTGNAKYKLPKHRTKQDRWQVPKLRKDRIDMSGPEHNPADDIQPTKEEWELMELRNENAKLRKILAHVPASVAIKAKEAAGYGAEVRAMKQIDDRMEAQQAEYEMGLDAAHEGDDL